jgi:hypothetical protein
MLYLLNIQNMKLFALADLPFPALTGRVRQRKEQANVDSFFQHDQ